MASLRDARRVGHSLIALDVGLVEPRRETQLPRICGTRVDQETTPGLEYNSIFAFVSTDHHRKEVLVGHSGALLLALTACLAQSLFAYAYDFRSRDCGCQYVVGRALKRRALFVQSPKLSS